MEEPRKLRHRFDFCVVGGGLAGICAAIAGARNGAKIAIVQDRPVFGGNVSSEIRIHICDADRHNALPNLRVTGILEELRMENCRRNPNSSFSIWDMILYEKIHLEPNITHFLNCSCLDAEMDGTRIKSITGWQLTTYTYHTIEADVFADCSGDGILAPLTGAEFRVGREAQNEYNESHAPETADSKTMGLSCLFHARDWGSPQKFEPPTWAYRYPTEDDLPYRWQDCLKAGYWWIELGGDRDSIHDTEEIRDELLKTVFGVWDHIKNHGDHGAENWALDWVGFLPGKRESRRYVGEYMLTQNDIEAEGRFDDLVAYGGWPMDDHAPAGMLHKGEPTTFYPTPSPYGIPYRCLYSKNVDNLMFAGRCVSGTHMAMSSARVMGTAASMGQAVGTAAAIAIRENMLPGQVGKSFTDELQQALLCQDAYLPWIPQRFSPLTTEAKLSASSGDPEPLRDGTNRPVGDNTHSWVGNIGDWVAYQWETPRFVESVSLVFDSGLSTLVDLSRHVPSRSDLVPPEMVRDFHIEVRNGGEWQPFGSISGNCQRLVRVSLGRNVTGVRVVFDATWGSEIVNIYAMYL